MKNDSKNSIKESIDAMCKSLGFKKDRRSGHYMREVIPGLEDAIHFSFKPYSGKAVSVSFVVGIYLKELVDLIDELYEKTDGYKSLLWLWCGDLLPDPKVVQWMYYTENGDPEQLCGEIRQFIVDYAEPFFVRNHDWKDISDSIIKRKYADAEGTPVAVAMYYRGEQDRGIDYWTEILKGRDNRNEKDELFLKKYRSLPPYYGDIQRRYSVEAIEGARKRK